ncbi:hypothetical protein BH24DEI2_BH24DEI2_08660 [soil metagenome]
MSDSTDNKANKTPQDLEADIASTRERISQNIDALSDRVNPKHLQDQAKDTLAGAQEAVMGTVSDLSETVTTRARDASSGLIGMIKSNPVPAALIGLGVGLLAAGGATAASKSGGSDDYGYDTYGGFDQPSGSAQSRFGTSSNDALVGAKALPRSSYGQEYGGGYGGKSSQSSGNQSSQSSGNQSGQGGTSGGQGMLSWVEEHPLAVGAVTLLIGAVIGLSAPGTRYENEVMGEVSDRSIERAKSAVGEAVDVVKESATQATKAVKEEWSERGLSADQLKEGVKSAAEKVTAEVKDATKNVVDATKQKAEEKAGSKTETTENA